MVETAVESHLIFDLAPLERLFDFENVLNVVIDGLFAENVLARGDRFERDGRVRVRGRADENGVYLLVRQDLLIVPAHLFHAEALDELLGLRVQKRIRHGDDFRALDIARDGFEMYFAYAPCADYTYFHIPSLNGAVPGGDLGGSRLVFVEPMRRDRLTVREELEAVPS